MQNKLGMLYLAERSDRPDFPAALKCFRAAAELGHAAAQNSLALMLAGGQGTPKDTEQACLWFVRAANQGEASAQFNLAARFHRTNVRGLTPDASQGRIQALMWFLLSAAQNYARADEWCERLRVDMSRAEVLEAQRRAAEFVPCKESAANTL